MEPFTYSALKTEKEKKQENLPTRCFERLISRPGTSFCVFIRYTSNLCNPVTLDPSLDMRASADSACCLHHRSKGAAFSLAQTAKTPNTEDCAQRELCFQISHWTRFTGVCVENGDELKGTTHTSTYVEANCYGTKCFIFNQSIKW